METATITHPQDSTQRAGHTATTPYRLVLVEDHPMVRMQLEHVLRAHSDVQIVGTAADGEEAITAAHRLHPEVVVMDFNMPKLNGAEATRRITASLSGIKVIGVSFDTTTEVRDAFIAAGAVEFVDKQQADARLHPAILAAVGHPPGRSCTLA